ncbi:MAG: tetratricopeptide repeat protein [Planctomycetes bacterium]|nr:tetratricopeptide repeat protein [Planctomycetota bacterium]
MRCAAPSADLRRLLSHEPIQARSPSRTYLLRKFVRRNRILCSAGLAVFVALTIGMTVAMRAGRCAGGQDGSLVRALTAFEARDNQATTPHAAAVEQLVLTMERQGEAAAAIPFGVRAVAMRRSIHGPTHVLVARALDVLALTQLAAGNGLQAEQAAKEPWN